MPEIDLFTLEIAFSIVFYFAIFLFLVYIICVSLMIWKENKTNKYKGK